SSEVDAKGGAAVYVSDYSADTVTVFSSAGKQTAQATGFSYPEGVTGASDGDIYVANTGVSAIEVYSAGLKKLVATLSDTGNYPSDASVDTKTGAVGVANISATSGAAGSVTFFAKGATTPCATVTASNWNEVYFAAFDAQGDLYIDGFDSNDNVLVGVVNGGCKATKITTLAGAKIKYPGGIQIAASGDILIDDQSAATVYTYKPPVKNKFGSPVATTPLSGAGDPVAISLNSTSKDVYDADGSLLEAQEFAYPKGGAALQSFVPSGATYTLGVFVTPDSQP
ncbi:MAG: hypothetical protein IAI50_06935, partial [Candidatus Eremiobacteraeota bacterium]|nr:hypothetical protein [Candidatus Eremiobacteraeota bacterium]